MFRKLVNDVRGNFVIITVFSMVPIMGALALAVDYTELNRQRNATLHALDAAGIATARRISQGATEEEVRKYALDFFNANLDSIKPSDTTLSLILPNSEAGGGVLKLKADLVYKPIFFPVFNALRTKNFKGEDIDIAFSAKTEIRLKNTTEVALVLDNSGSMANRGDGSSKKRIDLLKEAATYLVEELANGAKQIQQIDKPVQFSVVPFSAAVNIGPGFDSASWMDISGISPVHHENFDWTTMTVANNPNKWVQKLGNIHYKRGIGWNYTDPDGNLVIAQDTPITRFSVYQEMKVLTSREWVSTGRERVCTKYKGNGTCQKEEWVETGEWVENYGRFASWQGCIEARPYPYNVNDAAPTSSNPATLFVPMFAPDEPGNFWRDVDGDGSNDRDSQSWGYGNNYWVDSADNLSVKKRQQDMRKYFMTKPMNAPDSENGDGPNRGCTTTPITPLQDVTTNAGLEKVKDAIDEMQPSGNTDVPQGIVWGWRTLSSGAPFTEGRLESEKGNDKILIVLTDGANTYGDISNDDSYANNQSTYAAHGYTGVGYDGKSTTRLFLGTSGNVGKTNYSSSNYTKAHDEHMQSVCGNAKNAKLIIFTVALDLPSDSSAVTAMKECASTSRYRMDAEGKPAKLFYNSKGGDLMDVFKAIAEELSNLRIVG